MRSLDICFDCQNDLPWLKTACDQCAMPFADQHKAGNQCGTCLKKPPYFDKTIALFHYQTPINHLITSLKFQHKLNHAHVLGQLMAEKIEDYYKEQNKPEYIIPVPLHSKRLRERGFNQALELARPLAKKLGIPLLLQQCKRIKQTEAQSSTPAPGRAQNIKNAFVFNPEFSAAHVAIIDDVMTTGSTVNELARMLKKAGVARIDVWCCARTLIQN